MTTALGSKRWIVVGFQMVSMVCLMAISMLQEMDIKTGLGAGDLTLPCL